MCRSRGHHSTVHLTRRRLLLNGPLLNLLVGFVSGRARIASGTVSRDFLLRARGFIDIGPTKPLGFSPQVDGPVCFGWTGRESNAPESLRKLSWTDLEKIKIFIINSGALRTACCRVPGYFNPSITPF